MASRPVMIAETFSEEESWYDCSDHFESMAEVNKWDNAAKLLWLRIGMMGQAIEAAIQRGPSQLCSLHQGSAGEV